VGSTFYLPKYCPLYPDMRVIEYLKWTAAMKGLRRPTLPVVLDVHLRTARKTSIMVAMGKSLHEMAMVGMA